MPRVYNQERGRVLKGALIMLGITQKEAANAIGRDHLYVSRILNDDAESNPIITAITRFVKSEAEAKGDERVLAAIDWADELETASEQAA